MNTEPLPAQTQEEWRPKFNPWLICISVMLVTVIEVFDTMVTSVAVPNIAGNLGVTTHDGTWVVTSYLVSNAIILPATAWFSGFFGRKRFLLACIFIFTAASLMCGFSGTFSFLLFSLVLQGIGGGALQPISQAVLMESFPKEKRGLAMAVYMMGVIVTPVFAPVVGGWITDNMTWRWIFFINIPIGLTSLFLVHLFVEDPPYIKKSGATGGIDYIGFALMALGLATLQIILDKGQTDDWLQAPWICWASIIVLVSLAVFSIWELCHKSPVVNLRILKDRNLSVGLSVTFVLGAVMYGLMSILPLYFQTLMDYTPYLAGLGQLAAGVGTTIGGVIVAQLVSKVDGKTFLLFGLGTIFAGAMMITQTLSLHIGMEQLYPGLFVMGFGISAAFNPLASLTLGTLSNQDMGNGSGLFNLMRNIGGSVGIAVVTTVCARKAQFHQGQLIAHLTPFDPVYQTVSQLHPQANAVVYKELLRQSALMAYIDVFYAIAIMALCCIPFVLLFRKGEAGRTVMVH